MNIIRKICDSQALFSNLFFFLFFFYLRRNIVIAKIENISQAKPGNSDSDLY